MDLHFGCVENSEHVHHCNAEALNLPNNYRQAAETLYKLPGGSRKMPLQACQTLLCGVFSLLYYIRSA